MRDPIATRLAILETSGALFNVQGYKATSISDITKKLGMTKGAIYRHFESKSDLEKEALNHLTKKMLNILQQRIKAGNHVSEKMDAIFDYFISYTIHSPIPGGCPLLNAAIETDDTNPALKKVLANLIDLIHSSISHVLNNGIKRKQLKADFDADAYSSLVFSSLEGAIMMTKVTNNICHMENVISNLQTHFRQALL